MTVQRRIRIGDLLVENGVISREQLSAALVEQKKRGLKLGRTLVELGYLAEDRLLEFLAKHLKVPLVDLSSESVDLSIVQVLPETLSRRFRAIVLEDRDDEYLVGMADPSDMPGADEIARVLRRPIQRAVVRESELLRLLDLAYRPTDELNHLAEALRDELGEAPSALEVDSLGTEEAGNAPVAKLLATIFEDAVKLRASDIHIEPDESVLRIRQRVDGVLQEHTMSEKGIAPALVQRLKLMCGLDISEKRMPQDGRFQYRVKEHDIDIRLSTMPVQYGETVVMRLLDQRAGVLDLEQLGMPRDILDRFRTLLQSPHGMLLVTGPTGSGKTTTLYAALATLNRPESKIITVEDPVEYRISRLNQVQVNARIDLSFSRVLRAALRQDPDALMIGEIRDHETAQIALRAAMTGHLVLSTLHTNDSISTAIRLADMGVPGYLVASSLRAVLAQRLVRRICEHCAEPHTATESERRYMEALLGSEAAALDTPRGAGCSYCHQTGYHGRVGVYELLEIDAFMADALRIGDNAAFERAARERPGFRTLAFWLLEHIRDGATTLEEALRTAGEPTAVPGAEVASP